MKRRIRPVLAVGVMAGAMVLLPSGAAMADDDSQAMEAHMEQAGGMDNPGMDASMDPGQGCTNMMVAPPFGGDSPHA